MKKNIGIIIDTLMGGGVERVAITLASALSALGHRVDMIVFHKRVDYPINNVGFNVHFLETDRLECLRAKIKALDINFDLILSHSPEANQICLELNLPNHYCCIHAPAAPTTVTVAPRKPYRMKRGISRLLGKIKYNFSQKTRYENAKLIAVSKGVAESLIELGINPKSVQTIYNPLDFAHIRTQAEQYSVDESNYIIHLGRYAPQKRQEMLINAYHQSGIQEKLLLFGQVDGPHSKRQFKQAQALVANLHLQDRVIFKDFNPNPFPFIKNAKLLVLNSDIEALGMVLIEALVLGVPVVSTNCPFGPNEILVDELSAFLSPVGDVEALATNIRKMLQDPVEITEKYIRKFSAEKIALQYLALCND